MEKTYTTQEKSIKINTINFIEQQKLVSEKSIVILGFSGGPDSVFLLQVLLALKKNEQIQDIIVAHLDHQWRPDSSKDVAFCKQLAATYTLPFVSDTLHNVTNTIKWNGSQEEIGRKARRLFFEKIRRHYNADVIALGHHRDDQQETFFIRLMRGSSLVGLCGMRPKHGYYIRPLLPVSKQDILHYLETHQIPYLIDPSNSSPDYLRNRIRHSVLPALRACDDRFDKNSIQTIKRLQETERYLAVHTQELFEHMSSEKNGAIAIAYDQLLTQPKFMQYRLLIEWFARMHVPFAITEPFLKEVIRFLVATKSKKHLITMEWILEKKKKTIELKKQ